MDLERGSAANAHLRARPQLHLDIPRTSPLSGSMDTLRSHVASLFNGRSVIERPPSTRDQATPKSTAPRIGLALFTNHRIHLPHMGPDVASGRRSPSSTHSIIDPSSSPSPTIQPLPAAALQTPDSSLDSGRSRPRVPSQPLSSRSTPVRGADREEESLLQLMEHTHRRRRRRKPRQPSSHPPRALMTQAVKSKAVRHRACTCLLLGILLAVVLTIYLALSVTDSAGSQEFHILLVMIILVLTIFFCHAVIRLCMLILQPRKAQDPLRHMSNMDLASGYAEPPRPIQVHIARDEELADDDDHEEEEEEAKTPVRAPPPAYGLWRGSVRMNPNLVYWQRATTTNQTSPTEDRAGHDRPLTANRPPSYISDDGVGYVVEAQPRSTVHDAPMPVHPSERGRLEDLH